MSANTKTADVKVQWKNRLLKEIKSVEIEDHDQLIDKATIVLDDTARIAPTTAGVEETVKIEMGWDGHTAVLFEGLVVEGSGEHAQTGSRSQIVAYDYSIKMHRTHNTQTIPKDIKLSALVTKMKGTSGHRFLEMSSAAMPPNEGSE